MSGNSSNPESKQRCWGISRGMPRNQEMQFEVPTEIPVEFATRRPTRLGLLMTARAKSAEDKVADASGSDEG